MSDLKFGIPNIRVKKEEKYPNTGCITFMPIEKEGAGRKMILNEKALELLNITDMNNQISFSFSGADIYIVNTSGITNAAGLKVGKTTGGFSDKKHYNYIKSKTYNMNDSETLELFFEETTQEYNNNKVFKLITINPDMKENIMSVVEGLSKDIAYSEETEKINSELNA